MKITLSDVPDFIALIHPKLDAAQKAQREERVRRNFSQYCGEDEMVFLSRGASGFLEGALFRVRMQEGAYAAANIILAPDAADSEVFTRLLQISFPDHGRYHCRLVSGPNEAARSKVLQQLGFLEGNKRIEFRRPLEGLPGNEGSPLQWRALPDLSDASLAVAAALIGRAGEGDPDFSSDDRPEELLRAYLKERELSTGPGCVHLGYLEGKEAAIVIAQVQASDGWSRITYMGLLPDFRGKGLGKWVHRHGFAMMRSQAGITYHGGTLAKNSSMIRLFEKHHCPIYREMREFCKTT